MAIKVSSKASDASPKCRWSKRNIKEQKQTPSCSSAHINNAGTKPESPSHDYSMIWWVQPYSRVTPAVIWSFVAQVMWNIWSVWCLWPCWVLSSCFREGTAAGSFCNAGRRWRRSRWPCAATRPCRHRHISVSENRHKRQQTLTAWPHLCVWSSWLPSHL